MPRTACRQQKGTVEEHSNLRDISLELSSPNLIGLLEPNGAGQSTLMKLLVAGLLPTSDEIRIDGRPLPQCEK